MEDKKFIAATFIAIVLGIALVLAIFQPDIHIPNGDGRQITTTGTYTVKEDPDFATILINFESFGDTAEEAQQENADAMFDIQRVLKKEGLIDDDMKTTNYYVGPEYSWEFERNKITGYRASHTLEVTVEDYEIVGKYLDAAVSAGANQIYSVRFELEENHQNELKTEALEKASKDARAKADAMAAGVNMRVIRAVSVSDSSWNYWPVYSMEAKAGVDIQPYHEQTRIQPGDIEVTARVSAVFEIV